MVKTVRFEQSRENLAGMTCDYVRRWCKRDNQDKKFNFRRYFLEASSHKVILVAY